MSSVRTPDEIVTLYFVYLKNKIDNLNFLKIGVTSQELKYRLKRIKGFNKEVILEFKLKAIDAINLETLVLNYFYNYRYLLPKGVFKGQTELFKSKYKDEIVYFINKEIQRTSKEKTLEANTN